MDPTSVSLLDRLRQQPDDDSWQRLLDLYTPLIQAWLRRLGATSGDTDDLVQEVLTVVLRRLGDFERQRVGSFRRWLRTITVNCLRDFWRAQRLRPRATGDSDFQQLLHQLEDPHSSLSQAWDLEHDRHVAQRLLEMIQPRFEERTWEAFRRVALDGLPAEEVAGDLQMSVNAVFIAKSRVLAQLRKEGEGLLD